jgi:hypothetical protein
VPTLYTPFVCNQNNTTKRSSEVEKKGVLSSMIGAHLEKIGMTKMLTHGPHSRL